MVVWVVSTTVEIACTVLGGPDVSVVVDEMMTMDVAVVSLASAPVLLTVTVLVAIAEHAVVTVTVGVDTRLAALRSDVHDAAASELETKQAN